MVARFIASRRGTDVQIAYTAEQEALRHELRSYFDDLMTPEVQEECASGDTGGPACLEAVRKMGADGWLGLGWPKEFGGQARGEVEQFIFFDEAWRAQAPIPFLTINTVGRTIMEFGTDEQKEYFLPRILRGELHFSIGYTEPSAGTDLASLRTTAVRDGDEWVINGQKIYTSLANYADYIWLAARTDPDVPKHAGITIFAVPTTDPGFSYTKIDTMVNASTFNTYYDDVRVGDDAVIGELHGGWNLITNQLNYERVSLGPPGMISKSIEDVVGWAKETKLADGRRVIDQPWVQADLARVVAGLDALMLMSWKTASAEGANPADASATKFYATEFYLEAYRLLMGIIGPAASLQRGTPEAELAGRLERGSQGCLILTFGGGTNEIQRDLVALFGLGLPRVPRS
ncbi:MAG: acyl-CoA dehydrogenase family protein [Acidimicrobiales bacterium]|nr:acyl-CoA dehydrogenase family protein [Acidimicrobiales bacterium]